MKNQILLILLLPFLTSCYTLAGAGIDSIRNRNSNRISNTIQWENQLITFVTIHDVSLQVRYKGMIYKPDTNYHTATNAILSKPDKETITFPRIGDSLMVFMENQDLLTGVFSSIKKLDNEYELSLFNEGSVKTDQVKLSSINKLAWNKNSFVIHDPRVDRLFMKYEHGDFLHEIALSKLKQLNSDKPKKDKTFTRIGLGIDVTGIVLGIICAANNCLDIRFNE